MPQGRCCGEAPRFATGVRLLVTKLPRLLILLACVTAVEVGAQSLSPARAKTKEQPAEKARREPSIPKRYVPPAGMCRIWVDNVPSGRQPAPTDCTTAIRNRPPNARVVFGPGRKTDDKNAPPVRARPDTTPKRKPPA